MKKQIKFLLILLLTVTISIASAITVAKISAYQTNALNQIAPAPQTGFRVMTTADYEKLSGKKMGFIPKAQFKLAQKYAAKRPETDKSDKKTFSVLGLIAGAGSIVALLLTYPIATLLLSLAGLVFSIIGLKKEKARGLSILGIVLSGLCLLLIIGFVALAINGFT